MIGQQHYFTERLAGIYVKLSYRSNTLRLLKVKVDGIWLNDPDISMKNLYIIRLVYTRLKVLIKQSEYKTIKF